MFDRHYHLYNDKWQQSSDVLIVWSFSFSKDTYTHTNNFFENIAFVNIRITNEFWKIILLTYYVIFYNFSNMYSLVNNQAEHNLITKNISVMVTKFVFEFLCIKRHKNGYFNTELPHICVQSNHNIYHRNQSYVKVIVFRFIAKRYRYLFPLVYHFTTLLLSVRKY